MAALTLRIASYTAASKTATGVLGAGTITVSPDAFGIVSGHKVSGTGIGSGATVQSVNYLTNVVTLTAVNSGTVSGTVTFTENTKNSPLTNLEIDANFTELRRDVASKAPLDNPTFTNASISSGSINSTSIGATTRSSGAFTTLAANDAVTLTAGTASTSTTTGTLVVTGGIGASGAIYASSFNGSGAGLTNITSLGTVTTGTWSATNIALSKGGTNASLTAANGGVVYSTSDALAISAAGTSGQFLQSNGAAAPTWTGLPEASASVSGVVSTSAQTFVGSKTVRAASTQDGVTILGRAGGTSSYSVTLTPTTLSANRTITLPDATGTVVTTADSNVGYMNPTGNDSAFTRWMLKDTGYVYFSSASNTLDYTNGSHQRWAPSGTVTLAITNWPPTGNLGELLIEGVNLGSATITWPTINWIKPDGSTTTSFPSYGVTLQSSGIDWIILWTRDAGTTIYGKVIR